MRYENQQLKRDIVCEREKVCCVTGCSVTCLHVLFIGRVFCVCVRESVYALCVMYISIYLYILILCLSVCVYVCPH